MAACKQSDIMLTHWHVQDMAIEVCRLSHIQLSQAFPTTERGLCVHACNHVLQCAHTCTYMYMYTCMEREVGQKSRQDLDYLTDRFNDHDNRFGDRNNRFTNAASANSTSISQSI